MDVALLIRHRLKALGLEQRALAAAAQVTESYISQLLTRKKSPPIPERTDIYGKMERFLKLPAGKLAKLADHQRTEALKRTLAEPARPLNQEVRDLVLRKCEPRHRNAIRAIFEKEPLGPLERLATQKLLDVAKGVARKELDDEKWLRAMARLSGRSYRQMRVIVLEFLEKDLLNLSAGNCVTFLDPLIESWNIDLETLGMEIVLSHRLVPDKPKKFEFVEREAATPAAEEPGLEAFLRDPLLRGDARDEEIEFLKQLRFTGRRPTSLYYYRELQSLRDPLHFRGASPEKARPAPEKRGRAAREKR
jgi:transcriptional regulator with XRE-family HTH domain